MFNKILKDGVDHLSVTSMGKLQGLNKQEIAERYRQKQVLKWRWSFNIPSSKDGSLEMRSQRAVAYFKDCKDIHFLIP